MVDHLISIGRVSITSLVAPASVRLPLISVIALEATISDAPRILVLIWSYGNEGKGVSSLTAVGSRISDSQIMFCCRCSTVHSWVVQL